MIELCKLSLSTLNYLSIRRVTSYFLDNLFNTALFMSNDEIITWNFDAIKTKPSAKYKDTSSKTINKVSIPIKTVCPSCHDVFLTMGLRCGD